MYKQILSSIVYPIHDSIIKRRNTRQISKLLAKSQHYSEAELHSYQAGELSKLFVQSAKYNPYWQSTFSRFNVDVNAKDIHSELHKLPLMDKSTIRENFEQMLSTDENVEIWYKTTGGSTGIPLKLAYTPESFDWKVACSERGYGWSHANIGNKLLYIWGVQLGKQSKLTEFKQWLHHTLYNKTYFNAPKSPILYRIKGIAKLCKSVITIWPSSPGLHGLPLSSMISIIRFSTLICSPL
jgi:phenylacetate-CoA ligase